MSRAENIGVRFADADEEVRREAVVSLRGRSDKEALKFLDRALGDGSWRVRKAAVEMLRDFPERDSAIDTLLRALADSDNAGRRNAAVEALVALGGRSIPALRHKLDVKDEDVRKFAVDILGEIGDPAAIPDLVPLTRDEVENIRLAAVEALGSIGGDGAREKLLPLLDKSDMTMQFAVLHALARVGKPIPVESVKPLLSNNILKRAVYEALGQTKSKEAVNILAKGLIEPAKSSRQAAVRAIDRLAKNTSLQGEVEKAVRETLADASLEGFEDLLEGNLPTKRAVIRVLGMSGREEAGALLAKAARDDSVQLDVEDAMVRLVVKKKEPANKEAPKKKPAPKPATLGPMSNQLFEQVRDLVARVSGMYYDQELKYLVERRVQRRMVELGCGDYEGYVSLLSGDSGEGLFERGQLINELSTNETYFFREDFQLKAFKNELLPSLVHDKKKSGRKTLRIWSAGCSSGEEPYTLGIILSQTPGAADLKIEIVGSDINRKMIDKAKKAVYGPSSFRSTPDEYKKKYFTEEGGSLKLKDEIRKMVRFETANLLDLENESAYRDMDVIFCRNVIIYFSPEAKAKVVDKFHGLLRPGGYLLLGHSESLMSISTSFELVHLKSDLVYRKPERGGRP